MPDIDPPGLSIPQGGVIRSGFRFAGANDYLGSLPHDSATFWPLSLTCFHQVTSDQHMAMAWKPTCWISPHSPLNFSSRKRRQSCAGQSQRRTSNSLKVNETYKRGVPVIHLNPQSNLLSQQRQTSPRAPGAVLRITNYGIFCPAYVLLHRHVHWDRLLHWDLSNLESAKTVFCRGEFCNLSLSWI